MGYRGEKECWISLTDLYQLDECNSVNIISLITSGVTKIYPNDLQ